MDVPPIRAADVCLQIAPAIVLPALSSFVSFALSNVMSNMAGKPSAVFTLPFHAMTWIWLLGLRMHSIWRAAC